MKCKKCEHRVLFKISICGVISWSTLHTCLFHLYNLTGLELKHFLRDIFLCVCFWPLLVWQHFSKRPLYVYHIWREDFIDCTELGNHIHIWQPTRLRGECECLSTFISLFIYEKTLRFGGLPLSTTNYDPPHLNSVLMHFLKCSVRRSI